MTATIFSANADLAGIPGLSPSTNQAEAPSGLRRPDRSAVLLIDLQIDFLDSRNGKFPVDPEGALRVVTAANEILAGRILPGALPIVVVNQFPESAWLGNLLRRGAALEGSPGARLDPRIDASPKIRVFSTTESDAFSNPELEPYLRREGIGELWIVGVMSEGCVRATALAAHKLGFNVAVAESGIATSTALKARLASWLLRKGGVRVVPTFPAAIAKPT